MKNQWKNLQDDFVREILGHMGRQRMTGRALCAKAGISSSHWSQMKNLQKAISIEQAVKISRALGLKFGFRLERVIGTERESSGACIECGALPPVHLGFCGDCAEKHTVGMGHERGMERLVEVRTSILAG